MIVCLSLRVVHTNDHCVFRLTMSGYNDIIGSPTSSSKCCGSLCTNAGLVVNLVTSAVERAQTSNGQTREQQLYQHNLRKKDAKCNPKIALTNAHQSQLVLHQYSVVRYSQFKDDSLIHASRGHARSTQCRMFGLILHRGSLQSSRQLLHTRYEMEL